MALLHLVCLILLRPQVQDTSARSTVFEERFPPELTGELADDPDGSALMEALDWIRMHPYDLNSITMGELLSLPCVTHSGATAVLAFRETGRRFRSPDELMTIEGGSEFLYQALRPYVCVGRRDARGSAGHRASLRIRAVGSSPADTSTLGSPLRFSSRLVLEPNRGLEASALFAKGGGERPEDALLSGYALMRGLGCVTELMAGDYEIESGQGLVFWRGPTAVRSIWNLRPGGGLAIVPHRSSDESRFLRGLAIAVSVNTHWSAALFVSDRSYAATVDSKGGATGFYTGEYTTTVSAARRGALRERLEGLRAEYTAAGTLTAGCTFYSSTFDRSFTPADNMRFSGSRAGAAGADITGRSGILSLSGECAFMRGGAHAFAGSASLAPGGTLLVLRWRDYQPGYDNPHASGEGENGDTRNERGVSAALRIALRSGRRFGCSIDAFEHPWPTARSAIPGRGNVLTVTAESALPSGGTLSFRFSRKTSYDQWTSQDAWGRDVRSAAKALADLIKCEVSRHAGSILAFSAHIAYTAVSGPEGNMVRGVLLGGDIVLEPFPGVSADARFALFHTGGYSARLYQYESALPGLLSLPPLYGHGLRWYIRLRVRPAEWAEVAVRYAATLRDAGITSTGPLCDIAASAVTQIGIQADIRFP